MKTLQRKELEVVEGCVCFRVSADLIARTNTADTITWQTNLYWLELFLLHTWGIYCFWV